MALAQIMEPFSESTQLLETKFGPQALKVPMQVISCQLQKIILKCTATFLLYPGLTQVTLTIFQLMLIQDSHSIQQQRSLLCQMK